MATGETATGKMANGETVAGDIANGAGAVSEILVPEMGGPAPESDRRRSS
jgi:hypothetical protein